MYHLNTIIGRIAQPTVRPTNNGGVFLTFGLAVNEGRDDHTEWYNCAISGKFAEVMKDKLAKGQLVFASVKARTVKGNDGKMYCTNWVQDLRILHGNGNVASNGDQSQGNNGYEGGDMPF